MGFKGQMDRVKLKQRYEKFKATWASNGIGGHRPTLSQFKRLEVEAAKRTEEKRLADVAAQAEQDAQIDRTWDE